MKWASSLAHHEVQHGSTQPQTYDSQQDLTLHARRDLALLQPLPMPSVARWLQCLGAKNRLTVAGVGWPLLKPISSIVSSAKRFSFSVCSLAQQDLKRDLSSPRDCGSPSLSSQLYDNYGFTATFRQGTPSQAMAWRSPLALVSRAPYQLASKLLALSTAKGATALLTTGTASEPALTTWHCHRAHLSLRLLKSLDRSKHVKGLEVATRGCGEPRPCNTCHLLHTSQLLFPRSDSQTTELLKLVPTDTLSINVPSYGGRRYVITLVDDHSRMID